MVLVDTSCWTHALRRTGDPVIRSKVQLLLATNQAAWCNPIRLELWNGVRTDWDREILLSIQSNIPMLPITEEVWELACSIGYRARTSGLNVPATDILIFACARIYGIEIEANDRHYTFLSELK